MLLPTASPGAYRNLPEVVLHSGVLVFGDTFTASVEFAAEGVPAQKYSFKLGETFDYQSIDGTKPKLTITLEGGKIVENYKLEDKDREWQTTREVDGDVMTSTTTFAGKSVVQKLKKI
nr:hypothetical protein BaRGS_034619 [Batillaria attramentaria]